MAPQFLSSSVHNYFGENVRRHQNVEVIRVLRHQDDCFISKSNESEARLLIIICYGLNHSQVISAAHFTKIIPSRKFPLFHVRSGSSFMPFLIRNSIVVSHWSSRDILSYSFTYKTNERANFSRIISYAPYVVIMEGEFKKCKRRWCCNTIENLKM